MNKEFKITSDTKYLILENDVSISLVLKVDQLEEISTDISFVVDVYNYNNEIHPEGHYTWKRYNLNSLDFYQDGSQYLKVHLKKDNNIRINVDNLDLLDGWENKDINDCQTYLIQFLIRSNDKSNRILFNLKLPMFSNEDDKNNFYNFEGIIDENVYFNRQYSNLKNRKVFLVDKNLVTHAATSNYTLKNYLLLKKLSYDVSLYSENYDLRFNQLVKPITDFPKNLEDNDLIILFYYSDDDFINHIKSIKNARKIIYFHNITPPNFDQVYDPETSNKSKKAIHDLKKNIEYFDLIISNSNYTNNEIKELYKEKIRFLQNAKKKYSEILDLKHLFNIGIEKIDRKFNDLFWAKCESYFNGTAAKIFADMDIDKNFKYDLEAFDRVFKKNLDVKAKFELVPPIIEKGKEESEYVKKKIDRINFLFVGRFAGSKKIDDIIYFFNEFHKINPNSHLTLVGKKNDGFYLDFLKSEIDKRGLNDQVDFKFEPNLNELNKEYKRANVYIAMSEHEGFGMTIYEAAKNNCLIFAFNQESYRDIISESGYIFYNKENFVKLANNFNDFIKDEKQVIEMIKSQRIEFEKNNSISKNLEEILVKHNF